MRISKTAFTLAASMCAASTPVMADQVIANTFTDFGAQGNNGFTYGYNTGDVNVFTPMTIRNPDGVWGIPGPYVLCASSAGPECATANGTPRSWLMVGANALHAQGDTVKNDILAAQQSARTAMDAIDGVVALVNQLQGIANNALVSSNTVTRGQLAQQYDSVRAQIDDLVHLYATPGGITPNGTTLLDSANSLTVYTDYVSAQSLTIPGVNINQTGLGIQAAQNNFVTVNDIVAVQSLLQTALVKLRNDSGMFNDYSGNLLITAFAVLPEAQNAQLNWVSPIAGQIKIEGSFGGDATGGGATIADLYLNGTKLFEHVFADNRDIVNYLFTLNVNEGDKLAWTATNAPGSDGSLGTLGNFAQITQIDPVPVSLPSSFGLLGAAGIGLLLAGRRKAGPAVH